MGRNSLMYIFAFLKAEPTREDIAKWEAENRAIDLATVKKCTSHKIVSGVQPSWMIGARCIA